MNTVISLAMRPLISAVAALSLLLSACHYNPLEIPADNANLPHGTWSGTVTQSENSQLLRADAARVYLLRGQLLQVRDTQTGAVLLSRQVAGMLAARWRVDGVLVVLTAQKLLTFDPLTLMPKTEQALPTNLTAENMQLNADGMILRHTTHSGVITDISTLTLQPLPLATAPDKQYENATDYALRWAIYSPSQYYSGTSRDAKYTVFNLHTGASFTLPQHALPAGCQWNGYVTPQIQSSLLADGTERVLITYPDGQTDIFNADGTLVKTLLLNGCDMSNLYPVKGSTQQAIRYGNHTSIIDMNNGNIVIDSHDTIDIPGESGGLSYQSQSAITPLTSPIVYISGYSYKSWSGTGWDIANATASLKTNLATTWTNSKEGAVSGTVTFGDKVLTASGKISLNDLKIKAQGLPFSPTISTYLDLAEGSEKIGQLSMHNYVAHTDSSGQAAQLDNTKEPQYQVMINMNDGTYWTGLLTHPK